MSTSLSGVPGPRGSIEPEDVAPGRPGPLARTCARIAVHLLYVVGTILGDDIVGRRIRRLLVTRSGAQLGRGVSMHGATYLTAPRNLVVGADTFVNRGCYFDLEGPVVIGERVVIGHGATFVTTRHALGPHSRRCGDEVVGVPIVVGDGAWIGANATILPGVTIGDGAVVAAGSVVLHDVPDDVMVAGSPARPRRALG